MRTLLLTAATAVAVLTASPARAQVIHMPGDGSLPPGIYSARGAPYFSGFYYGPSGFTYYPGYQVVGTPSYARPPHRPAPVYPAFPGHLPVYPNPGGSHGAPPR
jgi:hypothetical protein